MSKVRDGVDLVLEEVAGVAGAVAGAVAALDHEAGDDAVEGGAVVEGLVVDLLEGVGVGPVLGAFGEADEVGDGDGGLFVVELAGEAAHGGVDDGGGAGGDGRRLELAGGAGGVGKLLAGGVAGVEWRCLSLRGYAEGEGECERRSVMRCLTPINRLSQTQGWSKAAPALSCKGF